MTTSPPQQPFETKPAPYNKGMNPVKRVALAVGCALLVANCGGIFLIPTLLVSRSGLPKPPPPPKEAPLTTQQKQMTFTLEGFSGGSRVEDGRMIPVQLAITDQGNMIISDKKRWFTSNDIGKKFTGNITASNRDSVFILNSHQPAGNAPRPATPRP